MTDTGIKLIAQPLKTNNSLEEIQLTNNNVGNDSTAYMSDVLKINKTLKRVYLDNNHIGDD